MSKTGGLRIVLSYLAIGLLYTSAKSFNLT